MILQNVASDNQKFYAPELFFFFSQRPKCFWNDWKKL